jgi:hemerythrin-like metal-binding protein
MQWKSEYETGIAEIDNQHQTIMQLVAEFDAAVQADANWNSLYPLITRTKEYTKFHFAVEESLMQICKYPRASAHRSEHRFILGLVTNLKGGVLRKQVMDELMPQFRTWLLSHFLESDRHFHEFMRTADLRVASAAAGSAVTHALIAESSEEDRNLLKMLLEANGYRVTAAGDGLEALAAARSDPPDVIVSNVLMPNMDGFGLCRDWMRDLALRAIPFVFYSGHYVRPDDAQVAASLGAARYLVKPLPAEVFLQELCAVLQQQATQALLAWSPRRVSQ